MQRWCSRSALANFVHEAAEAADFARLSKVGKSTVWRILDDHDINPHKIRYYLEKCDPDFDRKMQEVLMVYRDVSIYSEGPFAMRAPIPFIRSALMRNPTFKPSD